MEGFKSQKKIACFKEGGQVGYKSRKNHAEEKEMAADVAQDKAIVKKGVAQHEAAKHKGEGKTELKLKCGGRAKKEKGTVKKYAAGGLTEAVKSIGTRLKDNVMGTPEQNAAAQARLDAAAAKTLKGQGPVSDAERATLQKAVPKKRGGKC